MLEKLIIRAKEIKKSKDLLLEDTIKYLNTKIKEICDKHSLVFIAGMGTWEFYCELDYYYNYPKRDTQLIEIELSPRLLGTIVFSQESWERGGDGFVHRKRTPKQFLDENIYNFPKKSYKELENIVNDLEVIYQASETLKDKQNLEYLLEWCESYDHRKA